MTVVTAHPPASATLDFREVLYLFRNRLGLVLLCVLLAVAPVLWYVRAARPVYASTATVEVSVPDKPDQTAADYDLTVTLKTVERKLVSRSVLLGVIKREHLESELAAQPKLDGDLAGIGEWLHLPFVTKPAAPDSGDVALTAHDAELVRRFENRVAVGVVRGSRLISLTVEDYSPDRAQVLAQAIIDEFFRQARDARQHDTDASREQLLAEAKRIGGQFKAAEERLEAYRNRYQAVSLQDRQNIVVQRLRDLNQQVSEAKNARLKWEAQAEQVRAATAAPAEQLLSIPGIAELPEIVELGKQVSLQEARVATLAQRYGPLHPTMIQAKSELAELRTSTQRALQKAGSRIVQSYQSSKVTEASLERALHEQEQAALDLDRIAIPYHALEREVQAIGTVYQKVLDTLQQHDAAGELTAANEVDGYSFRVVEPPLAPDRPARPRELLLFGLSLVTGLFTGCGLVLCSRALDSSLPSVDAAESALGIPVLSTVPRSRHHHLSDKPLVLRFPASPQAEAFRSLRTAITMLPNEEERRCVMFTSAVPGEGKSFCALNCAAAFAQQGARTLLIDADLRRPSLRRLFSRASDRPDLTQCLRDPRVFPQAVEATGVTNLFCLGDWSHHPGSAELIGGEHLPLVLKLAQGGFDQVVIDTAPLMAVSDTLYLARHVPTVCLVIYAGKTPRRLARRALKLLGEMAHRSVAGLVLNKMNARAAGAQYQYYYYNG